MTSPMNAFSRLVPAATRERLSQLLSRAIAQQVAPLVERLGAVEARLGAMEARLSALEKKASTSIRVETVTDVAKEADAARAFWANHPIQDYYRHRQPQTDLVIGEVAKITGGGSVSVLELGCNLGRNLHFLREELSKRGVAVKVRGLDVNAPVIEEGRRSFGFTADELQTADERSLEQLKDGSFDCAFTVSVLDHLPDIQATCRHLLRIAPKLLVFVELDVGATGKVQGSVEGSPIVGFSYSFDYVRILRELGATILVDRPVSLGAGVAGMYRLITATALPQG